MKAKLLLPLIIFLLMIVILWRGLSLHPNQVPSPLIDKPAPVFALTTLENPTTILTNKTFLGKVSLFNVWATWCYACAEEHDLLLSISKNPGIVIYGLNYKDNNMAAKNWLKTHGNPYALVAEDPTGSIAIDWGVYGTPETFIIDKKGVVRYKQIGSITSEVWQETLEPLIKKLQSEQ